MPEFIRSSLEASSSAADDRQPRRFRMHRLWAVPLLLSALGVAGAGWYMLGKLNEALQKSPDHADSVPQQVLDVIQNRNMLFLVMAVPIACAMLQFSSAKSRSMAWLLFGFGSLWTFAVFALLLYCFIMFIAPLYQYQPL